MGGEGSATRTGETLDGRYRLDRHLADDGPAEVYAATDTQVESSVVVRMLRAEHALRARDVESFVAWPKALMKLSPPHVVRVFNVTSDDTGIPYVVEEAPTGKTLADSLALHSDGLSLPEAARIVGPVIDALARLHMAGVVHGRLDPRRIMLVPHGADLAPRLIHYGTHEDETGIYGSYVAPEHRNHAAASDPTMDVWSLGVLMHHLLCGHLPPTEPTTKQLLQRSPHLPQTLAAAISGALSADPGTRTCDAAVLWMHVESTFQAIQAEDAKQNAEKQSAAMAVDVTLPQAPFEAAAEAPAPVAVKPKYERAPIVHLPGMEPTPRAANEVSKPPSAPIGTQLRSRTPGTIKDEALRELLKLSQPQEHKAWPWVRVVLLLLLLLLFWRAVPWLIEPDFVAARRVLGPQLKIVAVAFAAVSVVAMARVWVIASSGNVLLLRPVLVALQVVALCICVLVGGSLIWGGFDDPSFAGHGHAMRGGMAWRVVRGYARAGLPYGVTALLSLGAIAGVMNALRSMRDAMALAIALMLLAAAGGAATIDLVIATIKPQLIRMREHKDDEQQEDDKTDVARVREAFKPRKIDLESKRGELGGGGKVLQRTSTAEDGNVDVMTEDFKRQREQQQKIIKSAEEELPAAPR